MSLVFIESYDWYDLAADRGWVLAGTRGQDIGLWGRRSTYGMRHQNGSGTGSWVTSRYTFNPVTTFTEGIWGMAYNPNGAHGEGSATSGFAKFGMELMTGSSIQIGLYIESDGQLTLRHSSNGTVINSSAVGYVPTTGWSYLELKVYLHDSAGTYEVRMNGSVVFSGTSTDTKAQGSSTADGIQIKNRNNGATDSYYDDIYFIKVDGSGLVDFLGDIQVDVYRPDGVGDENDFVPSSGSGFENVDEVMPNDDSDYNEADLPDIVGKKDLYHLEDTDSTGYIKGIQVNTFTRRVGSGSRQMRPIIKDGGSIYNGDPEGQNTVYLMNSYMWEDNPTSGSPWEHSEFNALQAGTEVSL